MIHDHTIVRFSKDRLAGESWSVFTIQAYSTRSAFQGEIQKHPYPDKGWLLSKRLVQSCRLPEKTDHLSFLQAKRIVQDALAG